VTGVPDDVMITARGLSKAYGLSPKKAAGLLRTDDPRSAVRDGGGFLGADDVDLTVDRGELFVIMGLSGSGKSTVLRMINRLVEPTAGELVVDGQDVLTMDDDQLHDLRNKKISMVFQHFALFPHRTVRENAAYGLQVRGTPPHRRLDRAEQALDRVGLGDRGDAYPHELSGGMKQRVGLARALATDADVLLMDEPFSALDPLIKRDMQELMFHFLPIAVRYDGTPVPAEHGYQVHIGPMYSDARGSVKIRSTNPKQAPALRFNYLSTDQDRREWVEAIHTAREILAQPAFDEFNDGELSPGPSVTTDEQILDWVARDAETAYHPSCTAKMGVDEMSVVDPQTTRVHGVEGLRVVDASAMPYVTNGNIYAPVMMLAEKSADLILGNTPLPPSTAPFYRHERQRS
jgi:ABC-type polar amino acid transport system ATPase subunit